MGMARSEESPEKPQDRNHAWSYRAQSHCQFYIVEKFNLARLTRGIMMMWQRYTPTAYACLSRSAIDCTKITRRIQSLMSLAIFRAIAARTTRYTIVTRWWRLTFTIIYRRVIKFPATTERHNPGTNKVNIEQATRTTASFMRNRLNFWKAISTRYRMKRCTFRN